MAPWSIPNSWRFLFLQEINARNWELTKGAMLSMEKSKRDTMERIKIVPSRMHWKHLEKKKSTRNWELTKVPCLQWKKSKRDTMERNKIVPSRMHLEHLEKKKSTRNWELTKVPCLQWKKVKEIQWKE